ncbi:MAG: 3'-5' exonuclease, partial [Acidimicrobiia bacterium]
MLNRLLRRGAPIHSSEPGLTDHRTRLVPILARLAGPADRIAVVDVETTGVYPTDRVVEVAIVTVGLDGSVLDEWETLVNPRRDLGPTWLHGVTGTMVAGAPRFEDIAGAIAARLDGAVLAAHNLAFDVRMLGAEFARVGLDFDAGAGVDTLTGTGCRLVEAANLHGLAHGHPHRALHDARTVVGLLIALATE